MSIENAQSAGTEMISAMVSSLQEGRAAKITQQEELIRQGNLAGALDNARAYSAEVETQLSKSRLTVSMSEQNKVGAFTNIITLGFNRKAQNVCFAIMHELIALLEREQELAQQRIAELSQRRPVADGADLLD